MFSVFYHRYKRMFWIIMAILLVSGAVSKWFRGSKIEVVIDLVLAGVSVIMALRAKKTNEE